MGMGLGLALSPLCAPPAEAHAGDADIEAWVKLGFTGMKPQSCVAYGVIDFDAMITHMPAIRRDWLSDEHSVNWYQRHATLVLYPFAADQTSAVLTKVTYSKFSRLHPDNCQFALFVSRPDKFGHIQLHPIIRWKFTASLDKDVGWDSFLPVNFPKVAMDYHALPYLVELSKEEGLPDQGHDNH